MEADDVQGVRRCLGLTRSDRHHPSLRDWVLEDSVMMANFTVVTEEQTIEGGKEI